MRIPDSFKKAIADVFYDKVVDILPAEETVDVEGGVKRQPGSTASGSFTGNVNYSNLKEVQEELGLTYDIDVAITTNADNVSVNDFVSYSGTVFVVTDVIPYDSHKMVVATKYGKV